MSRARVTIRLDNNKTDDAIRNLRRMESSKVQVGYRDGEMAKIAAVHEFGARIPVTDKMRAYLSSQGLHLKKSTRHIVIPERSFLRSGADIHGPDIIDKAEELVPLAMINNISVPLLLDMLGLELKSKIQDFARDLDSPANHPFTVRQKGSSNPLVDSGRLIQAMEVHVE